MISRSLQLPGSDSSALMTRKLGLPGLGLLGHEAPLHAGREAGAAAAAQARRLDHVDDRVLADGHQFLGIVPVAARLRRLQVRRLEAVDVGEDAVLVLQRRGRAHQPSPPLRQEIEHGDDDHREHGELRQPRDEAEGEEGQHDGDEDGDDAHLRRLFPKLACDEHRRRRRPARR